MEFNFGFEAIGTVWVIAGKLKNAQPKEKILQKIKQLIDSFDKNYSRFRKDSWVLKLSKRRGEYEIPKDGKEMLDLYRKLYFLTEGKFTPLIGEALIESGYDDKYSFIESKLSKVPKWDEILNYSFPMLEVKKPIVLDFGGTGKGYLIDLISMLLLKEGVKEFFVDGGGDIFSHSESSLKVGLEHPGNLNQVIGVVEIKNQSICASSGNRRKWGKFHHIIDPENLKSPNNILATWVIADQAIIADSLATCLFLVSPEKLSREFNFEYLILFPDYSFSKSADFPAELFLE